MGTVILVSVILLIMIKGENKRDKLKEMKDSIENIFFYLPEKEYSNMNDMPEYCKISLVFGQEYMKPNTYLSSDDYDTEVKKGQNNSIKAYSKDNITNTIKSLLGNDATLNIELDEEGDYPSLVENGCGYNNKNISILSYNDIKEYIYSINDREEENNYVLHVKWTKEEKKDNEVILEANALLTSKNEDGSYDVYADYEGKYRVETIEAAKDLEKELEDLYDLWSNIYTFTLEKVKDGYVWKSYKMDDYKYNAPKIVD